MNDGTNDTTIVFDIAPEGEDSLPESLDAEVVIARLRAENGILSEKITELQVTQEKLKSRIEWLERQVFGQKAERRLAEVADHEPAGENVSEEPPAPTQTVRQYSERTERTAKSGPEKGRDDLFKKLASDPLVRKAEIVENPPEIAGLTEGVHYTVISTKISHKIAVQPRLYTLLTIKRPVVKFLTATDTGRSKGSIIVAPIPGEVFERGSFDVSFIASLLVQKFVYHMPLYRVHDMITKARFPVHRSTLARLVISASDLLAPIYRAQLSSILQSEVVAMDEVPCRVGRDEDRPGKMNNAYFWPVLGDKNEIAFPYAKSREHAHVGAILKDFCGHLITDGYGAYPRYVQQRQQQVIHAGCWFHWRREFIKAEQLHHKLATAFLVIIRKLAAVEREAKKAELSLEQLLELRAEKSVPLIDSIFALGRDVLASEALPPSDPLRKAIDYGLTRDAQMRVFLTEPRVPMSTNDLERALRAVPMGRKAWLFCWSEVGGISYGRILSLISTCQLHDVDPYQYLVDILQRIQTHPVREVHLLTPRLWKENFAEQPMRSPLRDDIPRLLPTGK